MKLIDKTVQAFIAEVKSDAPAPGGGSAAALVGAVGAALGVMVGNLTVGSAKFSEVHGEAQALMAELQERLGRLEAYIDQDTEAFNQVMAAYKLPKASDEEKAQRSLAIQAALKGASRLPLAVAIDCKDVLVLAGKMLAIGNPNAASDAAVAGRLAHAAMWSAVYNVRINVGSIKDTAFTADVTQQLSTIIEEAEASLQALVKAADAKI